MPLHTATVGACLLACPCASVEAFTAVSLATSGISYDSITRPLHQSLRKETGPESGDLGLGTIPAILFELWALGQIILRLKIPVCLFVLGRVAVITWGLCEVIAVGPLAH